MELGAMITTLGAVKDVVNQVNLLKNLTSDIEKATEIQEAKQKALELTNTIITLQNAVMSMQADYISLVEENKNLKDAHDESKCYQLVEYPTTGILTEAVWVYEYFGNEKPKHYCCVTCFGNKKHSILHRTRKNYSLGQVKEFFECHVCDARYAIGLYNRKNGNISE